MLKMYLHAKLLFLNCTDLFSPIGDVINTELWIDGCSWVQEFKSLTKQNLNGLNKKYRQNCNCQVSLFCCKIPVIDET